MSMPQLPEGVDVELQSLPNRATVHVEDALIILCLIPLWLPVFGLRGLWVNVLMGTALFTMIVVLRRRQKRVANLFAELRKRQEMMEAMGGYPTIPGMMPPRMSGERPTREVEDSV